MHLNVYVVFVDAPATKQIEMLISALRGPELIWWGNFYN
jgi:hypothetical protein